MLKKIIENLRTENRMNYTNITIRTNIFFSITLSWREINLCQLPREVFIWESINMSSHIMWWWHNISIAIPHVHSKIARKFKNRIRQMFFAYVTAGEKSQNNVTILILIKKISVSQVYLWACFVPFSWINICMLSKSQSDLVGLFERAIGMLS